jgi:hypothetical protein
LADRSPLNIGNLRAEDILYRAITRGGAFSNSGGDAVTQDAFRLRPGEPTLSVALTVDKALGTLNYKGYTYLHVADVIEMGLELRIKDGANEMTQNYSRFVAYRKMSRAWQI